jgi:hypothetical protein
MNPMVGKSRESLSVRKSSSLLGMSRDSWPQANSHCSDFKQHRIPEHVPALPTLVIMFQTFMPLELRRSDVE